GANGGKPASDPGTNQVPSGIWVQRFFLDVVDYADPKLPTLRPPVNIPGQLTGLSRGGALFYTVGPHYTDWQSTGAQFLDASAYDGVAAALVDSMPLSNTWPQPLLFSEPNLFLGRADSTGGTSQIETWTLSNSGKFSQLGLAKLGAAVNNLGMFGQ